MQATLSERNVAIAELCHLVDSEKDTISALIDRCLQIEQQNSVIQWISDNLIQINKDRADKQAQQKQIESEVSGIVNLHEDLRNQVLFHIDDAIVSNKRKRILLENNKEVKDQIIRASLQLEDVVETITTAQHENGLLLTQIENLEGDIAKFERDVSEEEHQLFDLRANHLSMIEDIEGCQANFDGVCLELEHALDRSKSLDDELKSWRDLIRKESALQSNLLVLLQEKQVAFQGLASIKQRLSESQTTKFDAESVKSTLEKDIVDLTDQCYELENKINASRSKETELHEAAAALDTGIANMAFQEQQWHEDIADLTEQNRIDIDALQHFQARFTEINAGIRSQLPFALGFQRVQALRKEVKHFNEIIHSCQHGEFLLNAKQDFDAIILDTHQATSMVSLIKVANSKLDRDMIIDGSMDKVNLDEAIATEQNKIEELLYANGKLKIQSSQLETQLEQTRSTIGDKQTEIKVLEREYRELILQLDVDAAAHSQRIKNIEDTNVKEMKDASLYTKNNHECISKSVLVQMNKKKQMQNRQFQTELSAIQKQIDSVRSSGVITDAPKDRKIKPRTRQHNEEDDFMELWTKD
eukprot:CRZ05729.1 hypothetical protein [Spongospora subterranea]